MRVRPLCILWLLTACTTDTDTDTQDPNDTDPATSTDTDGSTAWTPAEPRRVTVDIQGMWARTCIAEPDVVAVVWSDDGIWLSASDDGGATFPDAPSRVDQGGPGDVDHPELACSDERIVVVWEDQRDSETNYENIYANVTEDGGAGWLDMDVLIDDDPNGEAISLAPKVALLGNTVHVSFYDQADGAPEIHVARSTNGAQRFSDPEVVSSDPDDHGTAWSGNPVIAMNSAGTSVVAWEDTRGASQQLFAAQVDAATHTPEVGLGPSPGFAWNPSLALDGEHAHAVWTSADDDAVQVYAAYSADAGATWSVRDTRIDAAAGATRGATHIVARGSEAWVAWREAVDGVADVFVQRLDAGGAVGEPVAIGAKPTEGGWPKVTLWADRLAVVWLDTTDAADLGGSTVRLRLFDPATLSLASDEVRLDNGAFGTASGGIHLGVLDGDLIVTWQADREVHVARLDGP